MMLSYVRKLLSIRFFIFGQNNVLSLRRPLCFNSITVFMEDAKMFRRCLILILLFLLFGCSHPSTKMVNGYVEGRFTYISSQTSGVLKQLTVARGELVKKDQFLFQLETTPENADFNQAKAKLEQAQSELVNFIQSKRPTEIAAVQAQKEQIKAKFSLALKTAGRLSKLNQKGYADQQQVDEAIANADSLKAQLDEISKNLKTAQLSLGRIGQVASAEANVMAAKAVVEKAAWVLSQTRINAPIDGRVFDTFYRLGEVVPANHPVLALLSPKNVYAVFYIPEKQLATLKIGQAVKIDCDNCKKMVSGKISFISPTAEFTPQTFYTEKSRSKFVFRVEAMFKPTDLHPGQPIDIYL